MDAVCLGILVADIFSSPVDSVPAAGELKLAEKFLLSAGGCTVNTAACLRRLGKEVRVLGKVGQDLFGDFVLRDLERLGIDASSIKRSQTHPTSGTFILNVKGEDRRYIHLIGANGDFCAEDIDLASLDGAKVLHVGGYLGMPKFGSSDLTYLFREAKKRSLKTVLDVLVAAGRRVSLAEIETVLPYTDVFLPNDDEARGLTGYEDPLAQADCLAELNPDCAILITLGSRGVLARRGNEVLRAGIYRMETLDESGAGDAFAAGVVTGLLEDWPFEFALRFASAMGASCTRALGCTDGVFLFDEATAFVQQTPLPITRLRG
jgi:sugar/nucleoside kinase (ribokinase family)